MVELVVEQRVADAAVARVVRGGTVTSHKGINLPDTELPFEITAKDRDDIRFAIAMDVDFLGVSYVAAPADLAAVRDEVARAGGSIPFIAKIERAAAANAIEPIVAAADAVMVARGDLGVEVPFERVPLIQKRILAAGRAAAVPVIVATDMLASMITNAQPTRAEVSDVANAVFDGADVLMLSGETAIGAYPRESVEAMVRTIVEAERPHETPADVARLVASSADATHETDGPDALAAAAARVAQLLDVSRIVVFTQSGDTARLVARYRPAVPIAAFTVGERVARQLQIVWGVSPGLVGTPASHEAAVELIDQELLREGERPGSLVVLLMGAPIEERPRTNLLRIHRIGEP
jgi:pyruvate kinase